MPCVFSVKNCRSSGHSIFRITEKGQSSVVPSYVPSYRNGGIDVDSDQIPTWRTFHLYWFHQFDHSYCNVLILLDNGIQSEVQEQCLVEEIYNPNANCEYIAFNCKYSARKIFKLKLKKIFRIN